MSAPVDAPDFRLDYVYIKFANLTLPTLLPWIEVGKGDYLPEESTEDEFVFQNNAVSTEEATASPSGTDNNSNKTRIKKVELMKYLESKLREPTEPLLVDYGIVEDICLQPANKDMVKSVFLFLAKYKAQ